MVKRCLPLVVLALCLSVAGRARAQDLDQDYAEPKFGQVEVGFDYLWAWMKGAFFPPMATLGNVNDDLPGALGQPGTSTILGGTDLDHRQFAGGRVNFAYRLAKLPRLSLEGNFIILEQKTFIFNTAEDGSSPTLVLAKPFFNPVANSPDADPRAFPAVLAGNVNFNYTTRLYGGELNANWCLTGDNQDDGLSINLLVGARYLNLQERYTSAETTTELPAGTGSTFFISDNFGTFNQYVAGQLGLQFVYRWDNNLALEIHGKYAAGPNLETLHINGFSSVTDQFGNVTTGFQGLYAQPSNIGRFHHTVFATMPEGGINFTWAPTCWFKLQVGSTFMFLDKVIRPGNEIDRVVNIQPVGATQRFGPPSPSVSFNQTPFWLEFINLGATFTF